MSLHSFLEDLSIDSIPDNIVVQNGIIINSGGYDKIGRPIIVFPVSKYGSISPSGQINRSEMMAAVEYYYETIRVPDKVGGIAILLDFSRSSELLIDDILAVLHNVKKKLPDSIQILYILQPENRKTYNFLREKLLIKKPGILKKIFKCNEKTVYPNLPTKIAKSCDDLRNYIERKYLLPEFAGYLNYDHECWIKLKQDLLQFIEHILSMKNRIPDVQDKVAGLHKYVRDDTGDDKEELINWIRDEFDEIIETLGLDEKFKETDEFLNHLTPNSSEEDSNCVYELLIGNPLLENTRYFVTMIRGKMVEFKNHFNKLFDEIKDKIIAIQLNVKLEDVGGDAMVWIKNKGLTNINQNPQFGNTLDESETIARNFHNNIYNEGMKAIAEAESNIEKYKKSTSNEDQEKQKESLEMGKKTINEFREKLQNRKKLYSDIFQFHLIYNRLSSWLNRFLRFLPTNIFEFHLSMQTDDLIPYGSAWKSNINQFLTKHPCPQPTHLFLIDKVVPLIPGVVLRKDARLLSYKLKIVLKLCKCSEVKVKELQEILDWKSRLDLDKQIKNFKENKEEIEMMEPKQNKSDTISKLDHNMYSKWATSQPDLRDAAYRDRTKNLSRSKDLIHLAENIVRESLRDAELIKENDIRISKRRKSEDEELSEILNQLMYDISDDRYEESFEPELNGRDVKKKGDHTTIPKRYETNNQLMHKSKYKESLHPKQYFNSSSMSNRKSNTNRYDDSLHPNQYDNASSMSHRKSNSNRNDESFHQNQYDNASSLSHRKSNSNRYDDSLHPNQYNNASSMSHRKSNSNRNDELFHTNQYDNASSMSHRKSNSNRYDQSRKPNINRYNESYTNNIESDMFDDDFQLYVPTLNHVKRNHTRQYQPIVPERIISNSTPKRIKSNSKDMHPYRPMKDFMRSSDDTLYK